MNKSNILLIFVFLVLLSSVYSYDISTETFKETDKIDKEIKDIPKTVFIDNLAYINTSKGYLDQYPSYLKKGEEANINFKTKSKNTDYDICFDGFKYFEDLITIKILKKDIPFWFDENLLSDYKEVNGLYCFDSFKNTGEVNLKFKAEYKGKGKLKYDIYILPTSYNKNITKAEKNNDLIILDPYLIGNLAYDSNLVLYMPFDNNISITYSSKDTEFTDVNTRVQLNSDSSIDSGTGCNNPAYVDDGSYSTYAYPDNLYTCDFELHYNITTSDTGFVWQVKDYLATINLTLPDSCFNFYDNYVRLRVNSYQDGSPSKYTQWSCFDTSGWNLLRSISIGSGPNEYSYIYDSSGYITNETDYSAVTELDLNSTYVLYDGLVAGYPFDFNFDSIDITGNYDGIDTSMTYNENGAIMNNDGYINTTYNPSSLNEYTFVIKHKLREQDRTQVLIGSSDTNQRFYFSIRNTNTYAWGLGSTFNLSIADVNYNVLEEVALSFNSTHFKFYRNGELEEISQYNGVKSISNYSLFIGAINNAGTISEKYTGDISKVDIYNRTLLDNEIRDLYNKGNFTDDLLGNSANSIYLNESRLEHIIVKDNNGALDFEGADEDFSVSVWVNITDTGFNPILDYFDANNDHWGLSITSAKMYSEFDFDNDIGTTTIPLNKWVYLTYVIDRNVGISFYINSVLDTTGTTMKDEVLDITTNNLKIGSYYVSDGSFNGKIDELMIYNYALTQNEIDRLYYGWNNSINFTLLDAKTGSLITSNMKIDLYNEAYNYTNSLNAVGGTVFTNGIPNGSLRIHAYGDGYDANILYKDIDTINSEYFYNIYMTNSTSESVSDVILHVVDEGNQDIENALVTVYYQNMTTGGFSVNSQLYTDLNGQTLATLVKDNYFYKFTVHYGGVKCYETVNPFLIRAYHEELFFRCVISNDYIEHRDLYNAVTTYLDHVNNTNVSGYFTYQGNSSTSTEFCLSVFDNSNNQTFIDSSCSTGTNVLININVNASNYTKDITFKAIARYKPSGTVTYQSAGVDYMSFNVENKLDYGLMGVYIALILFIFITIIFRSEPKFLPLAYGILYCVFCWSGIIRIPLLPSSVNIGSGVVALIMGVIITYSVSKNSGE